MGSLLNTFIKITLIHIKFISVFEFHVISVYCSIFNWGARGGTFFQCCLKPMWVHLISTLHIQILCSFKIYIATLICPQFCFNLKAVSKNTLVLWKPYWFCLILTPSRTRARSWTQWSWWVLWTQYILWFLWEICFIYKLLFPSFLPEPDVQQLLGFFDFFFSSGFNSTKFQVLWSWNTISPANAPVSMQAILCQCCTYWM